MTDLDELDLRVLGFCHSPRTVKEVAAAFPERNLPSIHRRVGQLLEKGLLVKTEKNRKHGFRIQTTEAGLQALSDRELQAALDTMFEVYPPLRLLPTPVHLASAILVLFSVAARRTLERHLPFFLLMGPPLTWKSILGEFLCHALGLDPVQHVVLLSAERGQSLFTRRGGTGKTVFKREVLDSPYVFLDELQLAAEPVRRTIVGIYMRGVKRVAFENEELQVQPVALIAGNPRKGQTLEERTGLLPAELRRGVIGDTGAAPIPESLRIQGEEVLRQAKSHGPIRPPGPPHECEAYRGPVAALLGGNTAQPQLIDVDLVMGLASGGTGYLPPPLAVRLTLHSYFTLAGTTGLAKEGWRGALAALGSKRPVPTPQSPPKPEEIEFEPLVRESRLVEIEEALQGVDPATAQGLVRVVAGWHRQKGRDAPGLLAYLNAVTHHQGSLQQLRDQEARLRASNSAASSKLQGLNAEIQSLGATREEVRRLHQLDSQMKRLGLATLDDFAAYVTSYRELQGNGYDVRTLRLLKGALSGFRLGVDDISHLALRGRNLQQGIAWLQQENENLKQQRYWLHWECHILELARDRLSLEVQSRAADLEYIRERLHAGFQFAKFNVVPFRCTCGKANIVSFMDFVESFRHPKDKPPRLPEGQP